MDRSREPMPSRVVSADGTHIAYWTSGGGPALVLLHGGTVDHARWDLLRPHLEPRFTIHAVDRRGRGASGDHPDYDIHREYEDAAAVVDAVAEASGSAVHLFGHSYGATCALGAAPLTTHLQTLMLYEPSMGGFARAFPAGFLDRLETLLDKGDREGVILSVYREMLNVSEQDLAALTEEATWPGRVAAAHTIPRELRSLNDDTFDSQQAASIRTSTLMLLGENTPDFERVDTEMVTAALSNVEVRQLEGQGHGAHLFAPGLLAHHLTRFAEEHA